jgi:signal transduction histidine kinase
MSDPAPDEDRVLLLSPTARDAATARTILEGAGLACRPCGSFAELCREIPRGAGAVVVPEEAVLGDGTEPLAAALRGQPPWSDLPVLVLTAAGRTPDARLRRVLELGGVTLLKRPLDVAEFLSAVRAALRDRHRQYQARAYTAELARQAEALREADRRKDEFLAMLAHELRNPLAPIRNGLQVLRLAGEDRALAERTWGLMGRQVDHLSRLVDDLLDVSRITRGKVELRPAPVDLRAVLAAAVETARPLIDAKHHRLTVTQPGRPVRVSADPVRLAQVVGNLLNNAAKYSEEGATITLSLDAEGDRAVVRVRDTGVGIPPEMLPRVFDLFTQIDRTLDRSQGGLGIGLTLVKSLVELHGGTVEAASGGAGTGSEFTVRLPLLPGADAAAADAAPEPPAPRRRVLVVDDNHDAGDSLGDLLVLSGHEVRVARNGTQAVEVAREFRPDVALLDIGLPGMSGYELAGRLRAEPFGPALLLVALTGYGQDEDRRRTREAGFDHHLTKPADLGQLAGLLARRVG